jgi:hypothetical protein
MEFPPVVLWSVPMFILLMVVERVSYLLHRDDDELGYGLKDTATSITMGLGSLGGTCCGAWVRRPPRSSSTP